jgi:predicted RNase H-like HicB family nuclease
MKLTAVFIPEAEGGYSSFVEEVPAAISKGETLEEAKQNLEDALRLVIECQRELIDRDLAPGAIRQALDLAVA